MGFPGHPLPYREFCTLPCTDVALMARKGNACSWLFVIWKVFLSKCSQSFWLK